MTKQLPIFSTRLPKEIIHWLKMQAVKESTRMQDFVFGMVKKEIKEKDLKFYKSVEGKKYLGNQEVKGD